MATVTASSSIACTGSMSLRTFTSWGDRPYMMINNQDVTDHGRSTSISLERVGVASVMRHTGRASTYYPANHTKIKISNKWAMLPDTSSHTYDGRNGRVALRDFQSSKNKLTLYIKKNDGTGYLSYDVFVSNYKEDLFLRRDFEGGVIYDIEMEFTEL